MIIGIAMGMRIFGEDLQRVRAERARKRDLGKIDPPEAGRRVDHHHGAARERHRDDARLAAEAEAKDEQRHQRQHRRRYQQQDVGGDDLLNQGKLGDDSGHHESDCPADSEAGEEFIERHKEMRPEKRPFGIKRPDNLARFRHNVLRHVEGPQQEFGAADDHHGNQDYDCRLHLRAGFAEAERPKPREAGLVCGPRLPVEFGDLVAQDLVHASLRSFRRPQARERSSGRGRSAP